MRMLLKCDFLIIGRHESHSLKSVDAAVFVLVVLFVCVFVYAFCWLVGFWYPCIVSHTCPDELFVDSEVVIAHTKQSYSIDQFHNSH